MHNSYAQPVPLPVKLNRTHFGLYAFAHRAANIRPHSFAARDEAITLPAWLSTSALITLLDIAGW